MKKSLWKKMLAGALTLVLSLGIMTGCGGGGSEETAADDSTVYEWDMVVTCSAQDLPYKFLSEYAEEVKEATDGRMIITVRPSGELPYTQDEYLTACRDGGVQMAMIISSGVSSHLQSSSIAALPMLVTSPERQTALMDALGDTVDAELSQYGVARFMDIYYSGQNVWGVGDTPTALSDLKAMKIRAQGVEQCDMFDMIGAVPVTVDWAEVPTSINRGVCDAAMTGTATALNTAMYEYCDWGYINPFMNIVTWMVYNEEAFNALPEDIQAAITDIGAEYTEKFVEVDNEFVANALDELEANGMELSYMTDEDKEELTNMMKDYWVKWAEEKGGDVPENLQKVLDALEL